MDCTHSAAAHCFAVMESDRLRSMTMTRATRKSIRKSDASPLPIDQNFTVPLSSSDGHTVKQMDSEPLTELM